MRPASAWRWPARRVEPGRALARRRVGAEPAALAPPGAPCLCPTRPVRGTRRPVGPARALRALWFPEPLESGASPHPPPLTPKCRVPSGPNGRMSAVAAQSHGQELNSQRQRSCQIQCLFHQIHFPLGMAFCSSWSVSSLDWELLQGRSGPQAGPSPQCRAWQTPGAPGRNAC